MLRYSTRVDVMLVRARGLNPLLKENKSNIEKYDSGKVPELRGATVDMIFGAVADIREMQKIYDELQVL
jgi:hypothetical protein